MAGKAHPDRRTARRLAYSAKRARLLGPLTYNGRRNKALLSLASPSGVAASSGGGAKLRQSGSEQACPTPRLGALLHEAVKTGKIDGYNGIRMLMEFGPPMHSLDERNMTPLHVAVNVCQPEVVQVLLNYGAEPHHTGGKKNRTPMEMAVYHVEKLDKKINNGGQLTSVELLARQNLKRCVMILDKAEETYELQGNHDENRPPLRVGTRVAVCGMQDHEMAESINGTVGILQHWHADIEKWRVRLETNGSRGPAFLGPEHLEAQPVEL